ncbi:MAG: KH domain-containing protein [Oscillospiraceae bacterium]|nr:KH domain-containing protein [Oscillospiraceae bacterium]
MEDVLISIVKGLVSYPEDVYVDFVEDCERGVVTYRLHVNKDDMGRVIGKQGKIARAIRRIFSAIASRFGSKIMIEFG